MWAGDRALKELFPILYNICSRKDGKLRDMRI